MHFLANSHFCSLALACASSFDSTVRRAGDVNTEPVEPASVRMTPGGPGRVLGEGEDVLI